MGQSGRGRTLADPFTDTVTKSSSNPHGRPFFISRRPIANDGAGSGIVSARASRTPNDPALFR